MWIDDQILKYFTRPLCIDTFVPDATTVVLGSGNEESSEVNSEACANSGVPVLRRYGGGGTVVLYSGCVVLSVGCWVKDQFNNTRYFRAINNAVINSLAVCWPVFSQLNQAGISDIVMGDKKIAGTSLFRSRNYLLYQASILVHLDSDLIEKLLSHPTKEPDYRKKRGHRDFLTSLSEIDRSVGSSVEVMGVLSNVFESKLKLELGDHLIEPVPSQMQALVARLERSAAQASVSKPT